MSRSPTVTTYRGPKADALRKLSALRGQFGPHGVEVVQLEQIRRGDWRLQFKLTPERERIRLQNLALRGGSADLELPESAREILAALFGGAELVAFQWAGRPAWRLSSKHTREKGADIALLRHHGLITVKNRLSSAGMAIVLRRLGGSHGV